MSFSGFRLFFGPFFMKNEYKEANFNETWFNLSILAALGDIQNPGTVKSGAKKMIKHGKGIFLTKGDNAWTRASDV